MTETVDTADTRLTAIEPGPSLHLPTHSKSKAAAFTMLVLLGMLVNVACGVLNYAIYTRGAILNELYDFLVSQNIETVVWVAAGISLLGAIFTLAAYLLSFDYRRPGRPVVRVWVLLASFAIFLAGLLLGVAKVDPDNVAVVLGALVGCLIFPAPVLMIEKAIGRGALRSAQKFLSSHSSSSARASARTALTMRPGVTEALIAYGLAAATAGRHQQALPYLLFAEAQQSPIEPGTAAALADAWEAAGNREKTIEYLDKLPAEAATPDLVDRKVGLWLKAGLDDRALEAMRAMSVERRHPWRKDYLRMLVHGRDQDTLHDLCMEIRSDDEPPFEKTVQCLKETLALFPSDTEALMALINLQKELKERDTVAALQEELLTLNVERLDVRRELVEYYWERGRRVDLVRHLNRVLMSGEASTEEKLRLLEETYTEGDYMRVEQLVSGESDLTLNARALSILANALFQGGRFEESLERVTQARRLGGDDRLMQNLDALAARINKTMLTTELTDLKERTASSPADLDLKFDYLDRLVASRAADRVVVQLDDLLKTQPDLHDRVEKEIRVMLSRHGKNRRLMEYLGDLYMRRRDYDKAFDVYERRAQGEMDSAEILHDAAQRILEAKPDHAPSLLSEMRYFHGAGDSAAALASFDNWQEAGAPADADVRLLEMQAAEKAGDIARALRAGEAILAQEPDNPEMLSHVARLAVEHNDFPVAIAHLQRAMELEPESFVWRRQLREAVETSKKRRMEEIKAELTTTPGNRDLIEELGDLYHDFDQLNDAITSYQKAGMNDPERRVPKAKQGYVLARKGLFTDADEILQDADLRASLPEEEQEKLKNLFFITAQLMEQEDEQPRALDLYRRIFRVDAGYRDVVEHIERLQVTNKKKKHERY